MNALEKYNIKFINKIVDGRVYKIATGGLGYIQSIKDVSTLNEYIDMTTTTINGDFSSIEEDPDVSSSYEVAFLTTNGVEVMDRDVKNVIDVIPLQDFKEMLVGWRDFLSITPLDGDNGIERFLKQKEINPDGFDTIIEMAKDKISEHQLTTYPKQNKRVFILWLSLLVGLLFFFCIILPSLNISNVIIPLSIVGAISISFSGFKSILYYKSWGKDFIERVGKPKFDLQTYFLVSCIPTILFYFIISWNFISGPGHNLYKLGITAKFIKSLIP
ncbi:hypothetical protein SAMN05444397_102399 [Flavobacterium aquidurense]|uniref:Uncharacterized protein n=1 Tax=Flavobacterium frigidimaris TaxID=262320 RepID=A0ABX4BQJ0_FLAFR|nr:hypothetical protein [Flavobacterium frigidimaris]OXA79156.1 hypothetical protein B0A65_11460 [Flavobacterium frigidimaris]SDY84319.1 hypothetical protein SAMN05444397_102399 [Flavobacterium aquidurense]